MLKVVKVGNGVMLKKLVFRCIGCSKLLIFLFWKKGFDVLLNVLCGVLKVIESIYFVFVSVLFIL